MIQFGLALKSKKEPYHRLLVLSETNNDYVVLVKITTDDGDWPDRACILGPADWSHLTHASTVAYSTAMCAKSKVALEAAINAGSFDVIPSPSAAVLKKVCQIGKAYKFTPPIAKTHIAVR